MLDNSIQKKLSFQKFLPILNTSNLKKDITRLEKLISKHENVECVEITLRNEDSFETSSSGLTSSSSEDSDELKDYNKH